MRDVRVHFIYVAGILVSIIIFLLTWKFADNTNLNNYVSFAATITSLFLGLVAIIYSIVSNSVQSQFISKTSQLSQDLKNASTEIARKTKKIVSKFNEIPALIGKVEAKVSSTHDLISELKSPPETEAKPGTAGASKQSAISHAATGDPARFVRYCSDTGLFFCYAAHISFKSKKAFNLNALAEYIEMSSSDYIFGYLVAVTAVGYLNHTHNNGIYTITEFEEKLVSEIEKEITKRLEKQARKEYLMDRKKKIEEYFERN